MRDLTYRKKCTLLPALFTERPTLMGFQEKARQIVFDYVAEQLDKSDPALLNFDLDSVYVVWFSKTLQNWKAMISTTLPDQMYYEVTYNGDKQETYLDAYKKFKNVCVKDDEDVPF